ncbi:hypothetical protein [Tessaracoccus sp. ZS01]|uniref:hypothetical protein n=1 Tax=Tessaracoccus sp. ZS01 TaxID=1906324 RepID=UPI00117C0673|nr:hypothetical protein [Tessaracoccus sp. ZS01]
MTTSEGAVVLALPQFLELLASGEEGRLALSLLGMTPEDLPLSPAVSTNSARGLERQLASTVAAATEHLQVIAPLGETQSIFAFRYEDSCAVFLMGQEETLGLNCSVTEAGELVDRTIEKLLTARVDWSVCWHSDDALHQVDVNPDGTVAGEPQVSLEELVAAFAA